LVRFWYDFKAASKRVWKCEEAGAVVGVMTEVATVEEVMQPEM
jgi:hypothetical protein